MLKSLLVSCLLALTTCAPAHAGDRVENDSYELPDLGGEPANVHIVCLNLESMYSFLDTLEASIDLYTKTGQAPTNCAVFFPIPLPLGPHELDHLFVTNDGVLYGLIKVPTEKGDFWTYIGETLMVKQETF